MRIGVDLLWLKVGKCGGLETFARNTLDGIACYDKKNEYVLFVAKDNKDSLEHYAQNENFEIYLCNMNSEKPMLRLMWEELFLDRTAHRQNIDVMFIPVYSKPWTYGSKIPYITCIADLQAKHYPEYFSGFMCRFLDYLWGYACRTSERIIAISDFVKEDIEHYYPKSVGKVQTIYVPIISEKSDVDFGELSEKYGIEDHKFFYCVSSMLPHKNLETMLKVLAQLKKDGKKEIVLLSGIGINHKQFRDLVTKYDVADCVIQTGYISNAQRDCLYEHCEMFLFPSIFEGFGMPPIEAMRKGKHVIMTRKTCLEEVTEGLAIYVEDPYDPMEWIDKINMARGIKPVVRAFEKYDLRHITKQYIELFESFR